MTTRCLLLPEHEPHEALVRRMARLSHERGVLVVSARSPAVVLRAQLDGEGADLARIDVLDVASGAWDGEGDPANSWTQSLLLSPTNLPLVVNRAARIVAESPVAVTTVVDDLASFLLANSEAAVWHAITYASGLRRPGNVHEYAVPPALSASLWANLRSLFDDVAHLVPDGRLEGSPLDLAAPGLAIAPGAR